MKWLCALAGLISGLSLVGATAFAQEDDYVQIYTRIQEADALTSSGEPGRALAKYLDAQRSLQQLQRIHPDWNSRVVSFRLNYLASKITDLSAKVPAPAAPRAVKAPEAGRPPAAPLPPGEQAELQNQVAALQSQVRQLQAERLVLEAKLKEAFSAQPAVIDPRELAKAEERVRALEKENSLLRVNLERQKAAATPQADSRAMDRLNRELADARRKLSEQADLANSLSLEKQALQNKLDTLVPASWNAASLESTRQALEESNLRLTRQAEIASQLALEKETLQARVKSLEADAEALSAMHTENEILKKQLADMKRPALAAAPIPTDRQLAEARAQIAALQSDKEILRLEKIALQNRVKQLSEPAITPSVIASLSGSREEAARLKQLERERADLQKKLEAAQKELYGRKARGAAARIEELAGQLQVLRARLEVYEAQQVPYSEEEMALFRKTETALAPADPRAGRKPIRELPAGSATLMAEARQDFASRRFDQAADKYEQILRLDEKNIYTLANLATIQLELNRLGEAETNVQRALALAPTDAYSLLVLGEIRFRQEKYDEALDVLVRAAREDPRNAEIQNYLGLTLSHKGMRNTAETAFRKAVQLDPNYASAHYNLAVFYATQKPPWIELSRWHYRKARAAGLPPNPELEKLLGETSQAAATGK